MAQKLNKLPVKSKKGVFLGLSFVTAVAWIASDLINGTLNLFWIWVFILCIDLYAYFMRFHGYRQQEF